MKYLGIDVGGTNVAYGIVNETELIYKTSIKTPKDFSSEETLKLIAENALSVIKKAGVSKEDICKIGMGIPGAVDREKGIIKFAPNLGVENLDIKTYFEKETGLPVSIVNDASAAAYGEYTVGALKGSKNAVAITIGTGIGCGIVIDGKIYSGSNFSAGEAGHMVIVAGGEKCSCGRNGCWERYASANALKALTEREMLKDKESIMWSIVHADEKNINGKTAFDGMRKGDSTAKKVVDTYISYLAVGLTNIVNILEPELVCIGGGVGNEKEYLINPLTEIVQRECYKGASPKTRIVSAKLGNDAGIIGAALS